MTNEELKSGKDKPDSSKTGTELAVKRTIMAADRSLMAWVRTGLSLISFGFTIYKFLDYMKQQLVGSGNELSSVSSPKVVGLYLIGMGILSLIFGTIENVQTVKGLRGQYNISRPRYSLIMSGLVALFGIVLFLSILFRMIKTGFN